MKTKSCIALIIALLLGLLPVLSMAEDGHAITFDFPENIRMATDAAIDVPELTTGQQVPRYTVTLRDFQVYFAPSLFPEGLVSRVEEHANPEHIGAVDEKSVEYWLNDGSHLRLSSALGMTWEGDNASRYYQLLRYLYDHDLPLAQRQLDFMTADEAVSLCGDLLERMRLGRLVATAVYGLSGDDIARYSEQMAAEYSDMKVETFSRATDHDAVYVVEFRSVFDAALTVGNAPFPSYGGVQCLFLIREDGPVFIEMSKVTEREDAAIAQPLAITLEDALRLFCAGKDRSRSDADAYEITGIAFGYDEPVGDGLTYDGMQTVYVPYYRIDYQYALRFGDQEKRISCEVLINALDGSIITIRGI